MKLDSLVPNARYDLVHGKPPIVEGDNDGSHLYRYNIEPEIGIPEDKTEPEQTGWQCREVRIWEKPSKRVLKKEIIRSVVDDTAEFSIINAYNKHVLGLKEDLQAVDDYIEYLQFTEDLDAMLLNDFPEVENE